jgi:UDP-N-acetylglucosamine diphosphorylase / glucose-1-phosphate thymidylyltransferase / UDP-N-acetylgalactosamine diphosphorylase / glucosamine-1-phosphate N-acetyltransferase / galactosamine-1-phosphate N-acetyltransferase
VEVKNSIVMRGTKIPHLTYVGDSVIGEDCNFGAGTQVANLRFDNRNIMINGQNSGRQKLGAIVGDKVKTGINVSINAGSVIRPDTSIAPGTTVNGKGSPD